MFLMVANSVHVDILHMSLFLEMQVQNLENWNKKLEYS